MTQHSSLPATPTASRFAPSPWVDWAKAIASQFIIWHHFAFYGPMIDRVEPWAPDVALWLVDQARVAVQVFLVLSGYLAARSLWPRPGQPRVGAAEWLGLVTGRVRRLAPPYLAALALALVAAALARAMLVDVDTPAAPSWAQVLANATFSHDLLGYSALSAGLWYVAIDLQLFMLLAALAAAVQAITRPAHHARRAVAWFAVAGLCTASLLWLNLLPELDVWAPYFFGAYGLGVLAQWVHVSSRRTVAGLALAALAVLALWVEWRSRIALAAVVSLLLVWQPMSPRLARSSLQPLMAHLARISYAVFLVHYPLLLLVGSLFTRLWPDEPLVHAAGLLLTWALALLAGWALWRGLEAPRATAPHPAQPLAATLPASSSSTK
jgi:peptidoglycan/LPS O-acetylase OafA/YrhL